jgi:hypothetical protein
MRNLSEEQWQAFLKIIRLYAKMRADLGLFLGMVVKSDIDQSPIEDWRGTLEKLRQLPGYVSQLEEAERLIAQADALTPDVDLIELISKIPPPDYLN